MSLDLVDFQGGTLTIANDSAEETLFSYTVPGGTLNHATLFQLQLIGTIATKLLAPGTITIRLKFGAIEAVVMAETLLANLSATFFNAILDVWVIPGDPDRVVSAGGAFSQDRASLFSGAGANATMGNGTADLSIDNVLSATVQFSVANSANIFTRTLAALTRL